MIKFFYKTSLSDDDCSAVIPTSRLKRFYCIYYLTSLQYHHQVYRLEPYSYFLPVVDLQAGMHIFVEKPLSVKPVEEVKRLAKELKAVQQENGVTVAVGYMLRYSPAVEVRSLAASCLKHMASHSPCSRVAPKLGQPYPSRQHGPCSVHDVRSSH
jgi:hypothetical protein